jgi:hypothetical protein
MQQERSPVLVRQPRDGLIEYRPQITPDQVVGLFRRPGHFTTDAGDVLDHRLQERLRRLDQMRPYLLEQVPPLPGRRRLRQLLFGGCQHTLEADDEEITEQVGVNVLGGVGPGIPAQSA